MEFSEYLQLDKMAHWPRIFLRHPVFYSDINTQLTIPNQ